MSLIAEFDIASPKLALSGALAAAPSMTLDIEQEFGAPSGRPVMFVWAEDGDFEAFERGMRDDETVTDVRLLVDVGERALYRVAVTEATDVVTYPMWLKLGVEGLEGTYRDGRWQSRMRFPDREALHEYRAWCADNDVEFELRQLYDGEATRSVPAGGRGLTDCQREALRLAREGGYFAVPRETSLEALAGDLDISEQAVSERIRRGTARLIDAAMS